MQSFKENKYYCWICTDEISREKSFKLDYLGSKTNFRRPISSFGLCKECSVTHGVDLFFGYPKEDDKTKYIGRSVFNPSQQIEVKWISSRKRTSRRDYKRIRREKLKQEPKCHCGKEATELNHLIPRYWIRLNGYKDNVCDFEENLIPCCRDCNQNWLTVPWEDQFKKEYWSKNKATWDKFNKQLEIALKISERRKIKIYKPPFPLNRKLVAQPVLRKPLNSEKKEFQIVALFETFWSLRTHLLSMTYGPFHFGNPKRYITPYLLLEGN